jgi:antitoxin component YwqK of YwqJK toxin-antitoxin module
MRIKILFICPVLFFLFSFTNGQSIVYLDRDLNVSKQFDAAYFCKESSDNGLIKLDCFNNGNDTLAITVHYKDSTLSMLQGPIQSYFSNQKIKWKGNYDNGVRASFWEKWDSAGHRIDSAFYDHGRKSVEAAYSYYKDTLWSYIFTDSINDKLHKTYYNTKGKITYEVIFNGQAGIIKDYKNDSTVKIDSVFTREEIEASFPGGNEGWKRYLEKNLNGNVAVDNGARPGTYQVIVKFIVMQDGTLDDIEAETHFGYGMEKEVVKVIKNGPKWVPGIQYGRKVKSYRRQPVTFVVQNP